MKPGDACHGDGDRYCPGNLALMATPGRAWRYRVKGVLVDGQIPETVETLTCPVCGSSYLTPAEVAEIDRQNGADVTFPPHTRKRLLR